MADILILTASFGMGHKSVSNAIKEQIEAEYKNAKVEIADILDIVNPKVKDFSSRMYSELTETYPSVYNKDINLITVITDVVDSWEWICEGTNKYLVPTDEIKTKLIGKGVDKDSILVIGIPVKKEFINKDINLSVNNKNTILLVLSGIDHISRELIYKLNEYDDYKIKIVTGRNEKLCKKLSDLQYSNVEVYGYVDNLNEMMDESLYIVTKPGGVTIFEAINKELPLIVLNSNIGQEKGNVESYK